MSGPPDGVGSRTNDASDMDPFYGLKLGSKTRRIAEYLRACRRPQKPAWIAEELGYPKDDDSIRRLCLRLARRGLLVRDTIGRYRWHEDVFEEEFARLSVFFDADRELEIHDLLASGRIANLFHLISSMAYLPACKWKAEPWGPHHKWVRVYTIPPSHLTDTGYRVRLTVFTNDRVVVELSSVSDCPLSLDQYCLFHNWMNAIFQEWTDEAFLFDDFVYKRIHINQDWTKYIVQRKVFVRVKVFHDVALAIYGKGPRRMRKELQYEGKKGIKTKTIKDLHTRHEEVDIVSIMFNLLQEKTNLQIKNMLVNGIAQNREDREEIRAVVGQIQRFMKRLKHKGVNASLESFKQEFRTSFNDLGIEIQDLKEIVGGGMVALTQSVVQNVHNETAYLEQIHSEQTKHSTLLKHMHIHQHEHEDHVTGVFEDLKAKQQHALQLLTKFHRSKRSHGRGRRTREKIVLAIAASSGGLTAKQLAEKVGRKLPTIYTHLKVLVSGEEEDLPVLEKLEGRPAQWKLCGG